MEVKCTNVEIELRQRSLLSQILHLDSIKGGRGMLIPLMVTRTVKYLVNKIRVEGGCKSMPNQIIHKTRKNL